MPLSTGETVVQVITSGFAEVGILKDAFVGRKVIKRLKDDVRAAHGSRLDEAFFRECQVAVNVIDGAPYVGAALLALRELDGLGPVLFEQFVDGPSLSQLLDRGKQSMSQALRVGWHAATALQFAHARDVRHRDLKPNNILLTKTNEVRIIDWGLSRMNDAAGLTIGRIEYFSPQRRHNPQLDDAADDVYALGVNLYHCLTGSLPPIQGGDVAQALRQAHPKIPRIFEDEVTAMLAEVAELRPLASEIVATLGDQQLIADVLDREVDQPFCERCDCVAAPTVSCPVCEGPMQQRVPRPPRDGMVRIPAGIFWHGLSDQQARAAFVAVGMQPAPGNLAVLAPKDDPQRLVFCPAFDIDRTAVTNAQFERFVKEVNYPVPDGLLAAAGGLPDHPVVEVSWRDALCYALWAGKRLPTPLEWEKAARGAADSRAYPWGNVWDAARCNHSQQGLYPQTSPVDAFSEGAADGGSPFGVLNMAGNTREWVSEGKHDAGARGLHGGGWGEPVALHGLVSLQVNAPVDFHDGQTGFRCAEDIVYDIVPVTAEDVRSGPDPSDRPGAGG